jgi:hypothetical protein
MTHEKKFNKKVILWNRTFSDWLYMLYAIFVLICILFLTLFLPGNDVYDSYFGGILLGILFGVLITYWLQADYINSLFKLVEDVQKITELYQKRLEQQKTINTLLEDQNKFLKGGSKRK